MQVIRLNKQNKTIKVVNRRNNLRLQHTRMGDIRLQRTGKTGPQGERGEQGFGIPSGGTTGQVLSKSSETDYELEWFTPLFTDKTFSHNFTVASTVTVSHNLEKFPSVTVTDSAGQEVVGDVVHLDSNSLMVYFTAPFSGKIICN